MTKRQRKGARSPQPGHPFPSYLRHLNIKQKSAFMPPAAMERKVEALAKRMFPSWTLPDMQNTIRFLLAQAEARQGPDAQESMCILFPPAGWLVIDFTGHGRIQLDPQHTSDTKPMMELAVVLKWIMGERFTVAEGE